MTHEKYKRKDKLGKNKNRDMHKLSHGPRAPQSIATKGDRWWFLDSLDHQPKDVEFVSGN